MTPLDFASAPPVSLASGVASPGLLERFRSVRAATRKLAARLTPEDMVPQSMPDASPAKWHLAHTSWFFETFILAPRGAEPFDRSFQYLFNSYYEAMGERHPRHARGLVTRPGVEAVFAYRAHVERAMEALLSSGDVDDETAALIALGLAHEEQHQELLVTDVLHLLSQNPLRPAYLEERPEPVAQAVEPLSFSRFAGGIVEIGANGGGFTFDNEGPRHQVLLRPFGLADRLTTNAEWLEFMLDGGYARPELWLSDGWAQVKADGWQAPFYWERRDDTWVAFGAAGLRPINPAAPVRHISFYEADAYARWRGARLPLEAEWEHAAQRAGASGAFQEDDVFSPQPSPGGPLAQMFGDVWEWTASPYVAYPGFACAEGAVGEYNGKFMINQIILRGGSCATPREHVRTTYRNFFQPHHRWQFSGVRLAMD